MADNHDFFFEFFGTQGECTKCGDTCDPDHILCNSCRRPLPAASHDETGQDARAYSPDPLGYDIPAADLRDSRYHDINGRFDEGLWEEINADG